MGSNVKSNIWLCAQAIPQMAERGNGSVVIVSSIAASRLDGDRRLRHLQGGGFLAVAAALPVNGAEGRAVNCGGPCLARPISPRAVGRRSAPEAPLRHHAA